MFRIWGKVIKEEKIVKQYVLVGAEKFSYGEFFSYLTEICSALDIATPVLLKTHIFNYAKFGIARFLPRDFAESVDFDKLILENLH